MSLGSLALPGSRKTQAGGGADALTTSSNSCSVGIVAPAGKMASKSARLGKLLSTTGGSVNRMRADNRLDKLRWLRKPHKSKAFVQLPWHKIDSTAFR